MAQNAGRSTNLFQLHPYMESILILLLLFRVNRRGMIESILTEGSNEVLKNKHLPQK